MGEVPARQGCYRSHTQSSGPAGSQSHTCTSPRKHQPGSSLRTRSGSRWPPSVPHRGAVALTASCRGAQSAPGPGGLPASGDGAAEPQRHEAAAVTGSKAPRDLRLCCALRLRCTFPTRRPRGGPAALPAGLRQRGVGFWPREGHLRTSGRRAMCPQPRPRAVPDSLPRHHKEPGHAGACPSTSPALTLGHGEQPGAPLAEEVVALHLRHRDPGGRTVPHGRGPAVPALCLPPPAGLCSQLPARGQLAFHFQFTLQPRGDPAAAGASSPCPRTHTQASPAAPPGCGARLGHLCASAGALRSAQPCQSEDAGPTRPITPRASGGCACLRRHIQGPLTL